MKHFIAWIKKDFERDLPPWRTTLLAATITFIALIVTIRWMR